MFSKVLFWILRFWFWNKGQLVIPGNHVNSYFTPTVDKTRNGPVAAPFAVQPLQFYLFIYLFFWHARGVPLTNPQPFLLLLIICFGCTANYNRQEAFAIIFLICGNFLNCLRRVGTIAVTTESDLNNLKVISTKKFFIETVKAATFRFLDLFTVRPPQKFQVPAKITTMHPVFSHYLSASYEHDNFTVKLLGKTPLKLKKKNKTIFMKDSTKSPTN